MALSSQQNPTRARLIGIACLLACALTAPVPAADEATLQRIWEQHLAAGDKHTPVIESCQGYIAANPGDPVAPMLHCLAAWHYLKAGQNAAAERLLQPYLSPQTGAFNEGAARIARAWLSRLDREKVAGALQAFYRKEVGYPKALAEIAAHPKIAESLHPIETDRFGKPWDYKLVGFGKIEGFANQRYSLESPMLGTSSDLAKALEAPYATGIDSAPLQVMERDEPLVKFKSPSGGGVAMITAGQKAGELLLAYVGERIIIVANHSYWKVYPRP